MSGMAGTGARHPDRKERKGQQFLPGKEYFLLLRLLFRKNQVIPVKVWDLRVLLTILGKHRQRQNNPQTLRAR